MQTRSAEINEAGGARRRDAGQGQRGGSRREFNPSGLLRILTAHSVEFVLIGSVAATIRGAIYSTSGTDVLLRRTPENFQRMLRALRALRAVVLPNGQRRRPQLEDLDAAGELRLSTTKGNLGVFGSISPGMVYDHVYRASLFVDLGGFAVRVLPLSLIIVSKTAAGRDEDMAVMCLLKATLDESRKMHHG